MHKICKIYKDKLYNILEKTASKEKEMRRKDENELASTEKKEPLLDSRGRDDLDTLPLEQRERIYQTTLTALQNLIEEQRQNQAAYQSIYDAAQHFLNQIQEDKSTIDNQVSLSDQIRHLASIRTIVENPSAPGALDELEKLNQWGANAKLPSNSKYSKEFKRFLRVTGVILAVGIFVAACFLFPPLGATVLVGLTAMSALPGAMIGFMPSLSGMMSASLGFINSTAPHAITSFYSSSGMSAGLSSMMEGIKGISTTLAAGFNSLPTWGKVLTLAGAAIGMGGGLYKKSSATVNDPSEKNRENNPDPFGPASDSDSDNEWWQDASQPAGIDVESAVKDLISEDSDAFTDEETSRITENNDAPVEPHVETPPIIEEGWADFGEDAPPRAQTEDNPPVDLPPPPPSTPAPSTPPAGMEREETSRSYTTTGASLAAQVQKHLKEELQAGRTSQKPSAEDPADALETKDKPGHGPG